MNSKTKNISLTYNDFIILKNIDQLKKRNNFNHLINNKGVYSKDKVNRATAQSKNEVLYLDLLTKLNLNTKNEVNLICLTYSYFLKLNPEVSDINYITLLKQEQQSLDDLWTFNELEVNEEFLKENFTCTYNGWIHKSLPQILKHSYNFNLFFNVVGKDEEKTFKTNEYGVVVINHVSPKDGEIYLVSIKLPLVFSTFTLSKVDEQYNCRRLYNKKYSISLIVKDI